MTRIELFSPLPPADCAARLRTATSDTRRLLSPSRLLYCKRLKGDVAEPSFRIQKRANYDVGYETVFRGTIVADGSGSNVAVEFAARKPNFLFTRVWLSVFAVTSCGIGIALAARPLRPPVNAWFGAAAPWLLLAASWLAEHFFRCLARRDAEFLSRFLVETLDAYPLTIADPYESVAV